jgi:hypothetical protein
MQYCPYDLLAQRENIIVAGKPTGGTTHAIEPFNSDESDANADLNSLDDTCVGIAQAATERGLFDVNSLVSSDTFSVDALATIYFLVDQEQSVSCDLLTALARMAIYEHGDDRDLAHVNFILNSWTDPVDSPLHAEMFKQSKKDLANVLYEELLQRLAKIIDKVDYLERYWTKEEGKLSLTETLLNEGAISLTTNDELDLAIFEIPESELHERGRLFDASTPWYERIHRMALHNLSSCSRILLESHTQRYFYFRADSLVRAKQKLVMRRGAMSELVITLMDLEGMKSKAQEHSTANHLWLHTAIDAPRAALWTASEGSRLNHEQFQQALGSFLSSLSPSSDLI